MATYSSVALVSAHQPIPAFLNYGISDLVELCSLAAFVRDVVGEVNIPVSPTDRDPLAGFYAFMRRTRPRLVGISAYTCGVESALHYARIAREFGALVVLGGYHASALPDELLACDDIDAVVRGEGEHTLRELVLDGPSRQVRGLSFKDGTRIVHNPDRPVIDDLDTLPEPLREVRPPRFGLDGSHYHVDTVYASRGCRGNCTFCANHLVGKRWRPRSNHRIVEELSCRSRPAGAASRSWSSCGTPVSWPTPTASSSCATRSSPPISTHVSASPLRPGWMTSSAPATFSVACERLASTTLAPASRAQTRSTLRLGRKGVRPEAVEEAGRLVTASGMCLSEFFVIGHANENVNDILAYADFAVVAGRRKQSAYLFILTPYPGTQTWTHYSQQGLIKSRDWNLFTELQRRHRAQRHPTPDPSGPRRHVADAVYVGQAVRPRRAVLPCGVQDHGCPSGFGQGGSGTEGLRARGVSGLRLAEPRLSARGASAPEQRAPTRNLRLVFYHRGQEPIAITFASDGRPSESL